MTDEAAYQAIVDAIEAIDVSPRPGGPAVACLVVGMDREAPLREVHRHLVVAAGVLDEGEGYDALVSAAVGAGLKQHEAARAVRNGIYRGKQEGAWDFSQSS